jgi:hypothetical protein
VQSDSKKTCLTISPRSHLHEALTTAASFLEHNNNIDYVIFVTDQMNLLELKKCYPLITFLSTNILENNILKTITSVYSEMEYTYAITPFVIRHLLSNLYTQVLFLKLETLVLGDLEPLFIKLNQNSAIVTPHLLFPDVSILKINQEVEVLMAGVFNGGVIGFRNTPEALSYLDWWSQKTSSQCRRDVSNGLHFEQRWLDFITSFISNLGIIRDKGINVAHWNLHERTLNMNDGLLYAGADRCLVFRFSGFDETNPMYLSVYKPGLTQQELGAASSIFDKYKKELRKYKKIIGHPK